MGCCCSKKSQFEPNAESLPNGGKKRVESMPKTWAYNRDTVVKKDNISAFDKEYELNEGK